MPLETSRLLIRRMTEQDAPFMLRLLNEPSFLHFIGDKGVRNLDDARRYVASGPAASYERFGCGLYLVAMKDNGEPAGMCGLVRRELFKDVDLGFAFVPECWSSGFAFEASRAVLAEAWDQFALPRVLAITVAHNARCIALLERLGFRYEKVVHPFGDDDPVQLYSLDNPAVGAASAAIKLTT